MFKSVWNALNKWGKAILVVLLVFGAIGCLTAIRWALTWLGF